MAAPKKRARKQPSDSTSESTSAPTPTPPLPVSAPAAEAPSPKKRKLSKPKPKPAPAPLTEAPTQPKAVEPVPSSKAPPGPAPSPAANSTAGASQGWQVGGSFRSSASESKPNESEKPASPTVGEDWGNRRNYGGSGDSWGRSSGGGRGFGGGSYGGRGGRGGRTGGRWGDRSSDNGCVMFVANCPECITDGDIYAHYGSLGRGAIKSIRWGEKMGQFMGFGFVTFSSPELAQKAVAVDPPVVDSRKLRVDMKQADRPDSTYNLKAKASELLGKLAERRAGKEGQIDFAKGRSLTPLTWTEEMMKAAPFQKDFSHILRLQPHTSEEVAAFRKDNSLIVNGQDAPPPVLNFDEVNFGDQVMAQLKKQYEKPTPIQAQGWPVVLGGRDCIALAQTGSGKTLGFAMPAIVHLKAQSSPKGGEGPVVLVIAPTRELILQISEEFEKFEFSARIRVGVAYGGQDGKADRLKQANTLIRGIDVLAATPGRLIDFVEAEVIKLARVTLLILDEADQMLDMGFAPQMRAIASQTRPDRQTLMFSATWVTEVQQLAAEFLINPVKVVLNKAEQANANKDVQQVVEEANDLKTKQMKLIQFVHKLKADNPDGSRTLIFVNAKSAAERLAEGLRSEWSNVFSLHGDIPQSQRERALLSLRKDPHAMVVATDVASRGLDIKDLACVINFDLPGEIERYVHRIGRTGRAGKSGISLSFFNPRMDGKLAVALIKVMVDAGQRPPEFLYQCSKFSRFGGSRGMGRGGFGGFGRGGGGGFRGRNSYGFNKFGRGGGSSGGRGMWSNFKFNGGA